MKEEQKYIDTSLRNKKIEFVKQIVSGYYKMSMDDFTRRTRKREIIKLKYVAIYIILERVVPKVEISLAELGSMFGDYDHATVLHAKRQIAGYLDWDKDLTKEVDEICQLVEHKLTIVEGKLNLHEEYHYINLNQCKAVQFGNSKAIVFAGFTNEEVDNMLNTVGFKGAVDASVIDFDKTNMYLIKKRNGEQKKGKDTPKEN